MKLEDSRKVDTVVSLIVLRGSSAPAEDLNVIERKIWFLARLEGYFNMTGIQNFFHSGLCFHYSEILACLDEIRAVEVKGWLEKLKQLYFGDADVPVSDLEKLEEIVSDADDSDGFEEARNALGVNSRDAGLEFNSLFALYVLGLIESGAAQIFFCKSV